MFLKKKKERKPLCEEVTQFVENKINYSLGKVAMQIGNAVPPKLGEVIGNSILKHLEDLKVGK